MATYLDGMDGGKHNSDDAITSFTPKKKNKHKIILSRTYLTEFVIEADDSEQARAKFNELGGAIYEQELEQ